MGDIEFTQLSFRVPVYCPLVYFSVWAYVCARNVMVLCWCDVVTGSENRWSFAVLTVQS